MTEMGSEIADGEVLGAPRTNPDESLFRQIHPSWVVEGVPSSQAFRPTKKDGGLLSVSLGDKTTAKAAFDHHTTVLQLSSAGTWAVTVAETANAGLESYEQPLEENPDHGVIDFRGKSRREGETAAKLLLVKALDRGRLHPVEPIDANGTPRPVEGSPNSEV